MKATKLSARFYFLLAACLLASVTTSAQTKPAYLNASLPTEKRVADLVSKLTLPQKIKLLQYRGTAIDSNGLKIPAYNWWNECLHGVAR